MQTSMFAATHITDLPPGTFPCVRKELIDAVDADNPASLAHPLFWESVARLTTRPLDCWVFEPVKADIGDATGRVEQIWHHCFKKGARGEATHVVVLRAPSSLHVFLVVPRPTRQFGWFLHSNQGAALDVDSGIPISEFAQLKEELHCFAHNNNFLFDIRHRIPDLKNKHASVCYAACIHCRWCQFALTWRALCRCSPCARPVTRATSASRVRSLSIVGVRSAYTHYFVAFLLTV